MRAGARIFHFDIGDGHFVPPITIGPIVLESISPLVHRLGGRLDCHLMVEPQRHFEAIAEAGGDSVTFHIEAVRNPAAVARLARQHELQVGLAFKPETEPEQAAEVSEPFDLVLCMSIEPGYSGQPFMPEALPRIERLRGLLPAEKPIQVDGGVGRTTSGCSATPGRASSSPGRARSGATTSPRPTRSSSKRRRERASRAGPGAGGGTRDDASEPPGRGGRRPRRRGRRRGWHRRRGEPHAEVLALEAAGERAAGSTLYLTMEPCAHQDDAALHRGRARRRGGQGRRRLARPEPGGRRRARDPSRRRVEVEHADLFEARAQNEAWRTWVAQGRPFVTYKAAMTLDGRLTIPGERWISGEESRRLVHELRRSRTQSASGWARCTPTGRASTQRRRRRPPASPARLRPRAASRRLGARAAHRPAPTRPPRREGIQSLLLEAARGSPPPFSARACSTSCSSSSRRSSPAPAAPLRGRDPRGAPQPFHQPPGRRRCAAAALCQRALIWFRRSRAGSRDTSTSARSEKRSPLRRARARIAGAGR